ncbi:MAG: hypothetical protein JNK35_06945 [Phycisphaerae bacterium]|nr:hypothetical protein [Phycisphaerae bacterium]
MLALLVGSVGCAGQPEGVLPPPGPATGEAGSVLQMLADWDDIEAAVDLAVSRSQCGYLEWHSDKPGGGSPVPDPANPDRRRWYTLLTIRDAQVLLDIRRDSSHPPSRDAPEPITIRCRVGPEGDSAYERVILDHLSARLAELRGDRAVPIPDPWGVNR